MNQSKANRPKGPRSQRRGRNRRTLTSIRVPRSGMPPTPFTYVPPQSKRVRLTWSGTGAMVEAAAGVGVEKLYRLNGVYDVDTAVGSTTTPGFTEWATFFTSYRVWRSSIHVEATCSGGSAGTLATVVLYPNATNTFTSSVAGWSVAPYAVRKTIRADTTSGGANIARLTAHYDMPSVFRVTRTQFLSDFDFTALTTTTPAKQAYAAIAAYGVGSATAVACVFQILVEMDIEFFNPIQLVA